VNNTSNKKKPFFFDTDKERLIPVIEHSEFGVITYDWYSDLTDSQLCITKCTNSQWIVYDKPKKGDVRLEIVLELFHGTVKTKQEEVYMLLLK
jgi:hypothetical protein